MTARLVSERCEGLLLVRLKGLIGFDEADFQLRDELVAVLGAHASDGGTHVLIDFSETSFAYTSSLELGGTSFVQKSLVGPMRVAACFGGNERSRLKFRFTHLDRFLDCFDTEAEALVFLRSAAPMTNGAALDHEFWAAIGPEVGPDACERDGCGRLRVALSHFCKRHHYEMLRGSAYAGQTDV